MAVAFVRFLRSQWTLPADPTVSFSGKTILVTGANTGLGFEAATKFVALGASRVILGVRNLEKGEEAKRRIEAHTGIKGVIEVWSLDMNLYDSIRELAARASNLDRLDVALLNAGVYKFRYDKSTYGWEETLQVNVISTALLGLLLLPVLRASSNATGHGNRPVLEIVCSGLHEQVVIHEDRLDSGSILKTYSAAEQFHPNAQYPLSKLLVMYVVQSLALLAEVGESSQQPVLVLAVCPGACKSDLVKASTGLGMKLVKVISNAVFMRTAEEGSRSLVSGTNLGDEAHGRFWQHDEIQR